MAKDILLFGSMWQYNAMFFFDQIKEALKEEPNAELVLRLNCEGGSPEYGMSIIEKISEMRDQFRIKANSMAHSWGLFFLCYVEAARCEALDVTQALLHRAAYPTWIEKADDFKGSVYEEILVKSNKDLEKAFRARVDIAAFEALPQMKDKNLTTKDIFSMEGRVEVILTGADLKKIGLVGTVTKITPTKSAELNAQFEKFKECKSLEDYKIAAQAVIEPTPQNKNVMLTLAELKEKHPAIYAELFALGEASGITKGVAQENDRIGAAMVFAHLDPKGVQEIIKSGKPMTATQQAEFALKAMSPENLAKVKAEAAKSVETPATTTATVNAELADFEKKIRAEAGLDKAPEVKVNGGMTLVSDVPQAK